MAWRSRFEPTGVIESFTWSDLSRRIPTVPANRSTTSLTLSAVVMSKPVANMWQESRQAPIRLSPPARSISSRSSSKRPPDRVVRARGVLEEEPAVIRLGQRDYPLTTQTAVISR
jgi:hypothetical protein